MSGADAFLTAREFLLAHRERYDDAAGAFRWPVLDRFNWALDYFDRMARGNGRTALWIVSDDGSERRYGFAELSERSDRVAAFLMAHGVRKGDRLLLMLPNVVQTWETLLACMKLGAVVVPATPQLGPADLAGRFARGGIRHVVTDAEGAAKVAGIEGPYSRLLVGAERPGWAPFEAAYETAAVPLPVGATRADDPFLLYFTSGTTAQPKLVLHTHASYPVGHLSTMYWIGLRPGDVHWNISSPGWGKHAWSSTFAPWNAGATSFAGDFRRLEPRRVIATVARCGITSLCAPPTAWRMLVGEDLGPRPAGLREVVSAGEPLNPEVIDRVKRAWGLTVRDGYGQTETTALVGNTPGQHVKPGSMGRPLPGFRIVLLDPDGAPADHGEIALPLDPPPLGLMAGYLDDAPGGHRVAAGRYYRTGDIAERDGDGYLRYVGRADDLFKSSDYRISPFEIESALVEHAAVAEAAVVPSPDAVRLSVPKAYVQLRAGLKADDGNLRAVALDLFRFIRARLPAYKRVRRLEFGELPKTVSGKIRRVELREAESSRAAARRDPADRARGEFWEQDFPELQSSAGC